MIGLGPGPFVEVHKEVSVQQSPSTQSSWLLHPGVGSMVLDCLVLSREWGNGSLIVVPI